LAVFQARVDLDRDAGWIRDHRDGTVEDELTRHALLLELRTKSLDVFDADTGVIERAAARRRRCRLGSREQQTCTGNRADDQIAFARCLGAEHTLPPGAFAVWIRRGEGHRAVRD